MNQVLIVDPDLAMRETLRASFAEHGWGVMVAAGAAEAFARFRSNPAEVVITDMGLKDGDGLALLRGIREMEPGTVVIVLTGCGNVSEAVGVMRQGRCDYLTRPVAWEQLHASIARLLEEPAIEPARTGAVTSAAKCPMVANSRGMKDALELAGSAARTEADILIEAESGTGKEMLARWIHAQSRRRQRPFVALNCAGIPETLLESELFGYVRGAFTGATTNRVGRFEQADGGTLLLDEIGEMPLALQPKLLRVLQEREVDRLGIRDPCP